MSADETKQQVLALPGPQYWFNFGDEGGGGRQLWIAGERLRLVVEGNQGRGTGWSVWDGAACLALHLDLAADGLRAEMHGKGCVLELVLPSISRNVSLNSSVSAMVSVVPLDWLRAEEGVRVLPGPPGLVIAADCVWLEELVEPFVRALEAATEAGGARVLMAYQSRSARIDDLLFGLLERTFSRSPVPLLPGEEGRGAIDLFSLTRKG